MNFLKKVLDFFKKIIYNIVVDGWISAGDNFKKEYKMENKKETKEQKTERLLSYLNESILDVICSEFDKQSLGYFEDKKITDDTSIDFAEWFEGWNGFKVWMELLQKDKNFQDDLMELVKHIAWTREPTK